MDWLMTDLGAIHNVREGDEVILFGRRDNAAIPLWELAEIAETIPYEILCGISERVPRMYLDSTAVSAGPGKTPETKRDAFKNK